MFTPYTLADSAPLAPMVLVSVRKRMLCACALRFGEQGFERWDRGAPYANVDFDDGPGVYGDGVEEGICGLFGALVNGFHLRWSLRSGIMG
jgi:hypothetical protein